MKADQNRRREKEAAAKGQNEISEAKEPVSGGEQPRSWKQYIEQTMPSAQKADAQPPVQEAPAKAEKKQWRRLTDKAKPQEGGKAGAKPPVQEEAPAKAEKTQWRRLTDEAKPQESVKAEVKAQEEGRAAADKAVENGKAAAAKAGETAKEAGKSAMTALENVWERIAGLTAEGWDRAGRATAGLRNMVARHPISPLLYVTVLAVGIGVWAFNGTYVRAYDMEINGESVGVVSDPNEKQVIVDNLETRMSSVLGEEYSYDGEITLTPVYATPEEFIDTTEVEESLFAEAGAYMEAYAISVDGVELGYAPDKDELYRMLDEVAQPYIPEADSISYEFVEDVQVYPVRLPANSKFDVQAIWDTISALEVEQGVYTVEKGDTFNAIAYSLDMMPNELSVLNPDVMVDKIWVGQELIIQEAVPFLSVQATTDETYEETVPSPVEYIETADLYVGDTKVKEQGEDGLDLVNAHVTYVNGVEVEREVITTQTLKEPTTTYSYTGTTPRPVTASNGYYIWPVRGRITSYFGGRNLWGRYDFHLGLDIACPTGTSIKAADGGTVITAGWSGSYGNLVAIRHDNGTVTYYAHNSSILVSVGQKVYQGQIIAKAGMTGNASGPHCHFEVRINGTSVNPLNYLS